MTDLVRNLLSHAFGWQDRRQFSRNDYRQASTAFILVAASRQALASLRQQLQRRAILPRQQPRTIKICRKLIQYLPILCVPPDL